MKRHMPTPSTGAMRTGRQYRDSLKDGRQVWMLGVGAIDDVTDHPLTCGMVNSYADWYDRHFEAEWRDVLLTPADENGDRRPIAFEIPRSSSDLRKLGKQISSVAFTTGGNMTHTPGYGALVALGLLDCLIAMDLSADQIGNAAAYRDEIARTGRFLTYSIGLPPAGFRDGAGGGRTALRVVREGKDGVVISGKVSMHTSSPFAGDVLVTGGTKRETGRELFSWFVIPIAAPGVRVITRRPAARHDQTFVAPMSHRYDELDAQLWMDELLVPWERVFTTSNPFGVGPSAPREGGPPRALNLPAWLLWHQHYGWLAKLEFTLGLALAGAEVMGYRQNPQAVEQLLNLVVDVQTARTCMAASELDPELSAGGFVMPGQLHVASASLHTLGVRQRTAETLRRLAGSSLVIAPSLSDFDDPRMASDLEDALGGASYTAQQRAALLNLISDHVSSSLDARESSYEMLANGGVPAWRLRMRMQFKDYNELANNALAPLEVEMPKIDVSDIFNIF